MTKQIITWICYAKQGVSISDTAKSVFVQLWTLAIHYWVEIKILDWL